MITTASATTGALYVKKFKDKDMIYSDVTTGDFRNVDLVSTKNFNIGSASFTGEIQETRF